MEKKEEYTNKKLMPAIFFGHGNPMNAIAKNSFTKGWAAVGMSIPRPKAVLAISAHWYLPGCAVTISPRPKTIHDFRGFPVELHQEEYPAPGSPELAMQVRELLAPVPVKLDEGWGLDHGTWSVLTHVFPEADVPVVQLSIDSTKPPAFHYEVGKRLASLREEGVLVIGSGNIVHKLSVYVWGNQASIAFDWGVRFENTIRGLLQKGDDAQIVAYDELGDDAMQSAPTPEHFLPLLYILALRRPGEPVTFPVEGFDGGAVSMLAVRMG
ncbi:MAG: 4,5-DOPA dioxygenase extradiol [Desulforhopalus sp.]|nr:4,5-DOPA dioxygenase extradiol [Desulforhopalus sp.]